MHITQKLYTWAYTIKDEMFKHAKHTQQSLASDKIINLHGNNDVILWANIP